MDVLDLLINLSIENEKSCADSFQFFMAGVIESIYVTTGSVNEDLLKEPSDPAPIIRDLFEHRNVVGLEGSKLREFAPLSAFHEYAHHAKLKLRDDKFISGHTLLAYLCARLALRHHSRGHAERAAMYAQEALDCVNFMRYCLPDKFAELEMRSSLARHAAITRLANDPKQKAKQYVFSCWQVWQEEPERYKSKADFAKNMLKQGQCEILESQKKIEDWCRAWEKTNPAG
jgi:hypothetical protein